MPSTQYAAEEGRMPGASYLHAATMRKTPRQAGAHQQKAIQRSRATLRARPEYVFLIIFTALSLMAAILLPAGAGYDEPSHIARVEQLAQANLFPDPVTPESVDQEYFTLTGSDDMLWGGV